LENIVAGRREKVLADETQPENGCDVDDRCFEVVSEFVFFWNGFRGVLCVTI
jgi:hypothetical protein